MVNIGRIHLTIFPFTSRSFPHIMKISSQQQYILYLTRSIFIIVTFPNLSYYFLGMFTNSIVVWRIVLRNFHSIPHLRKTVYILVQSFNQFPNCFILILFFVYTPNILHLFQYFFVRMKKSLRTNNKSLIFSAVKKEFCIVKSILADFK